MPKKILLLPILFLVLFHLIADDHKNKNSSPSLKEKLIKAAEKYDRLWGKSTWPAKPIRKSYSVFINKEKTQALLLFNIRPPAGHTGQYGFILFKAIKKNSVKQWVPVNHHYGIVNYM
jgi:hypothetical protein